MSITTSATAMMTRTSSITMLNTWLSVRQRSPRRVSFLYEAVRHRPFTGFIGGVRLPRAEKQSRSRGSWDRSWYSMASRTVARRLASPYLSPCLRHVFCQTGHSGGAVIRPQAVVRASRRLLLTTGAWCIPSLRQRPQAVIAAIDHLSAPQPLCSPCLAGCCRAGIHRSGARLCTRASAAAGGSVTSG